MKQDSRYIQIEWPEFKTKVRARLADNKNPTLCKFFWELLPIHVLQSHAMVSGDTMLAFHPYTRELPEEYAEDYLDEQYWGRVPAAVGCIGFKTTGYQAIVIQWGPERTEYEKRIPVAYVEEHDLETLAILGKRVFDGILKGEITTILITRDE
jgi:hypothetical protein